MVIGKIKPTSTIVAQFASGVEIEAIQHEGKLYLPVVSLGEFSANEDAPSRVTTKGTSIPVEKPEAPEKNDDDSKSDDYTLEELMDKDVKSLTKILKDEFGIDPSDYDGKNTNKKLRDLILKAQKGELDSKDDDKDNTGDDNSKITDSVASILEDFDAGKKSKKKSIAAICALVDDADEDKVTELVNEFEEDANVDLDKMAEKITDVLTFDSDDEPKKPSRRVKKTKDSDEELVSPEDLEVGDRVSVWFDDDNKNWFDGTVKSIRKGKVNIAYDDETEDIIDPEVNTKIKRLAK